MKDLTKRQREVYRFIEWYWDKYLFSPSLDEIKDYLGVESKGTVTAHLTALEKRGCISRDYHSYRGIYIRGRHDRYERVQQEPFKSALEALTDFLAAVTQAGVCIRLVDGDGKWLHPVSWKNSRQGDQAPASYHRKDEVVESHVWNTRRSVVRDVGEHNNSDLSGLPSDTRSLMVIPICDSFHDDPGRVVLGTVSFASAERELFNGEAKRSTEILLHRTYEMYEALEWFEKTMKNEA